MDPLYLRKLLINKQLKQETVQTHKTDRAESVNVNESTEINVAKQAENLVREMREEMLHPRRDLKMNYLASMERSSYVKKVMNLPKTLPELLMQLQNEDSIADDMPQMYYQQNKQKQENLKSDIREGVIRNAKESFEETLNKEINNNQHSELDSESNKPTQQRPNVENKPNTPQPPRHSKPTGEESQSPQPKPNVNQEVKPDVPQTKPNVDNKPNIPPQRPNMPVQPNPKPEIRPMYNPDDMLRQYENNELWQPNRNHGVHIAENKPNMPPRPPMNEGIRPEPMPQPRPPMNEGIRPEPMPRPLPPHKPIAPPHHQHPEHIDVKPDLPGFKPDIGLQEYMRYEMLRPQPLQPPPNTSISSEVHRHHHHYKHLPPPEEEISQETQAAMNVMQNVQQPAEPTVTQMRQKLSGDAAELFFTGLINLNDLSNTLKTNSKGAKAKLVLAMANASKHGIDNSQINDTLKMISASMAATETSTPSKVLKNIIELYLPWYPLQQGVGFDLSIETKAGEQDFLSVLKVWIQTRNYGNVNAILTLMTSNSVDMSIQCSEKFPKDDLLKRLNEETKNRTMQSNINVEEFEQTEGYIEPQQQAKVSLSSTYEMNPYLLLMAHSFIKNTIVIDSNMLFS